MAKFLIYCNGASSKGKCAAFDRKLATLQSIPVKRNGALLTGAQPDNNFLAVVDFDIKPGVSFGLDDLPLNFRDTLVVRTGSGGLHVYLYVDGEVHNTASKMPVDDRLREVDTRGQGGIIFAPGSKFDEHPAAYTFLQARPVMHMGAAEYESTLGQLVKDAPSVIKPAAATSQAPTVIPLRFAPAITYTKRAADVALPEPCLDILQGHFIIEHATQASTNQAEHLYWSWLVRTLACLEIDPCGDDVISMLHQFQPEFDEAVYRYQLTKVAYLNVPPKNTFTKKLFPAFQFTKREKITVGSPEWDQLKLRILGWPFTYLENDARDGGYWVKAADPIGSWFKRGVQLELQNAVRIELELIGMFGSANVDEMLREVKEIKHKQMSTFRINRNAVHFKNGIYIIPTREFIPRVGPMPDKYKDQTFYTFKVIDADYDPNAPEEPPAATWGALISEDWLIHEFERSLHRHLDNPEHPGQYELVWEFWGYCLSDLIGYRKALINRGPPRTFKTTANEIFLGCLESDQAEMTLASRGTFQDLCEATDKDMTTKLLWKKVLYNDDMGDSPIKSYEKFKERISQFRIGVREMYMNDYEVDNIMKFIGNVNMLPVVYNLADSFCDRVMPVFWGNPLADDELDRGLDFAMRASAKLRTYIVGKALKALDRLYKRQRFEGMDWESVMHWWRLESDIVYSFTSQYCTRVRAMAESDVTSVVFAYFTMYKEVAAMKCNDKYAATQTSFTQILKGYTPAFPVRKVGHRVWTDPITGEEKDVQKADVYFGLKVNIDKLQGICDLEAMEPTDGKKALSKTAAVVSKKLVTMLSTLDFVDQHVPVNQLRLAFNANNATDVTADLFDEVLADLKEKRRIALESGIVTFLVKKPGKQALPPEPEELEVDEEVQAKIDVAAAGIVKDLSDATLDEDIDKTAIINLALTTDGKIWPEKCAEKIDNIGLPRAAQLLAIMATERMVKLVDSKELIYEVI